MNQITFTRTGDIAKDATFTAEGFWVFFNKKNTKLGPWAFEDGSNLLITAASFGQLNARLGENGMKLRFAGGSQGERALHLTFQASETAAAAQEVVASEPAAVRCAHCGIEGHEPEGCELKRQGEQELAQEAARLQKRDDATVARGAKMAAKDARRGKEKKLQPYGAFRKTTKSEKAKKRANEGGLC